MKKRLSNKRRKKSKFSIGDFVRLRIEKAPFMKRYQEIWTEEQFIIIDAMAYDNPTTCKIKYQDNEPIKRTFYEQELQFIVEPKTYRIEKVIQKKKKGDRALLYVKRKDYSDKFNSYMFQDEIES